MEVFTTKIRLNDNVCLDDIWNIYQSWITESPHYSISSIDYDGEESFYRKFGEIEIKILNTTIASDTIFALQLINPDKTEIWTTDCIYIEGKDEKRISVTLSCHSSDYKKVLPRIHKPHIIKKLIQSGLCYTKGILPISDTPIYLQEKDTALCAKLMLGMIDTPLPVVYLSVDGFNPNKYSANERFLAQKLSGIAHVLVEPDKHFSKRIKTLTDSKNPYNGYVGIYFSKSLYKEIVSFEDCYVGGILDRTKMSDVIRATVQQALLNHDNTSDYSWSSIQVEYHRKRYESESQNALNAKRECDAFIDAFDANNNVKDEKIAELQRQLESKNAIIESLKIKSDMQNSISFKSNNICEFYNGELNDLIIHLLSGTYKKSKDNMTTRQKELLDLFLKSNSIVGYGQELIKEIEKALKEKSLPARRTKLEKCGFTVQKGSHDKVYFHDPKYIFTLANSPSEHRGDENMLSDIRKRIDIYRKI